MTVTIRTYTLRGSWVPADAAEVYRQMFVDSGLMTDWYDTWSYQSGYIKSEHRVLRLTNDAAKTYGYQYIWFQWYYDSQYTSTSYVLVQFATGWNVASHVPTGTQYYDYVSASMSASTSNFATLHSWSATQTYVFTTYTSGDWVYFGGSANYLVRKTTPTLPDWIDLDKVALFTFFGVGASAQGSTYGWRLFYFYHPYQIRRMLHVGRAFSGSYATRFITSAYCYGGYSTADGNDPSGADASWGGAIRLPNFYSASNPAYDSNYAPIITGIDIFPLTNIVLPEDFGFVSTINSTPTAKDLISVTPGVEVWEVMASVSSGSPSAGMSFLARTT